MAAVTRQPFAPLNGARLQSLTSLKNRQNALPSNGPAKRKASDLHDLDDFENLDPVLFSKRSKGSDGVQDFFKPSTFLLTQAASAPSISPAQRATNATPVAAPLPRAFLQPKSPAAKLNTSIANASAPQSAPAGRSPTRGSKRIGLLSSRRRTSGPSRFDPPACSLSQAIPFSLDAALKGTIPSYAPRLSSASSSKAALKGLHDPELKSSWFFDIHEDTPEQEMTNLLQHSTCVLDISSDEESVVKVQRERAEGRDKENVPPADDVSQTTRANVRGVAAPVGLDDMVVEKARNPLGEMNAADFYSVGCDGTEVVIVPGDEDDEAEPRQQQHQQQDAPSPPAAPTFDFAPEHKPENEVKADVDRLMAKSDEPAAEAALLEPIEGTGDDNFELWESGSTKDEAEAPAGPASAEAAAA